MRRRFPVLLAVMIALWVAGAAVLVRTGGDDGARPEAGWTAWPIQLSDGTTYPPGAEATLVVVPDVVGLEEDAFAVLCLAGLVPVAGVAIGSAERPGVVVATLPPAGSSAPPGTAIEVQIAGESGFSPRSGC